MPPPPLPILERVPLLVLLLTACLLPYPTLPYPFQTSTPSASLPYPANHARPFSRTRHLHLSATAPHASPGRTRPPRARIVRLHWTCTALWLSRSLGKIIGSRRRKAKKDGCAHHRVADPLTFTTFTARLPKAPSPSNPIQSNPSHLVHCVYSTHFTTPNPLHRGSASTNHHH